MNSVNGTVAADMKDGNDDVGTVINTGINNVGVGMNDISAGAFMKDGNDGGGASCCKCSNYSESKFKNNGWCCCIYLEVRCGSWSRYNWL